MMNGIGQGGGWFFGGLILIGVVLLGIVLVRVVGARGKRDVGGGEGTSASRGPSSARQLLDERYARGDLTTDEYRDRIRVLGEGT
jgi:putative membrane protein